jgi:hypothetical protein
LVTTYCKEEVTVAGSTSLTVGGIRKVQPRGGIGYSLLVEDFRIELLDFGYGSELAFAQSEEALLPTEAVSEKAHRRILLIRQIQLARGLEYL